MDCFSVPKFIFNTRYDGLSGNSKILYGVAYSYFLHISEATDVPFRDENGFFVDVKIDKLAYLLGVTESTIYDRLRDLEKVGLIHRKFYRDKRLRVYLIYAKEPPKK